MRKEIWIAPMAFLMLTGGMARANYKYMSAASRQSKPPSPKIRLNRFSTG